MLKWHILLTSALVGAELIVGALGAQAGGMAGFHMPHSYGMGGNVPHFNGGGITNNINRSTNINVNRSLSVYSPVTITNNIDRSTNISANVNVNNSKTIDNSTNISVNKEINIRTTNIFNGMPGAHDSDHSQGGSWGSHSGGMGGGMGCGQMCGGGNSGGSNQNNNGNENNNGEYQQYRQQQQPTPSTIPTASTPAASSTPSSTGCGAGSERNGSRGHARTKWSSGVRHDRLAGQIGPVDRFECRTPGAQARAGVTSAASLGERQNGSP